MLKPLFFSAVLIMAFGTLSCTALTENRAETRPDHKDPSLRTRIYRENPEAAFSAVLKALKMLPKWEVLDSSPEDGQIRATRTTRLFRFVDDVEISIRKKDAQEVELNLKSASRVGKGDFGQNARNIRTMLKALDQLLADKSQVKN